MSKRSKKKDEFMMPEYEGDPKAYMKMVFARATCLSLGITMEEYNLLEAIRVKCSEIDSRVQKEADRMKEELKAPLVKAYSEEMWKIVERKNKTEI